MIYKPSDSYYGEFTTRNPNTGILQNMDNTATLGIIHNGVDSTNIDWLSVVNIATGIYSVVGTIPVNYLPGDRIHLRVTVTVGGITDTDFFDNFTIESNRESDLIAEDSTSITNINNTLDIIKSELSKDAGMYLGTFLVGIPINLRCYNYTELVPDSSAELMIELIDVWGNRSTLVTWTDMTSIDSITYNYTYLIPSAGTYVITYRLLFSSEYYYEYESFTSVTAVAPYPMSDPNLVKIGFYDGDSTGGILVAPIAEVNTLVRNSADTYSIEHLYSDSSGYVYLYLDNGDYLLRVRKGGYLFSQSIPLHVSGDTTLLIPGEAWTVPDLQLVYGTFIKPNGQPDSGLLVTATITSSSYTMIDEHLISNSKLSAQTDDDGYFELYIIKGAGIRFTITNYRTFSVTITDDDEKNITEYFT